MVDVVKNDTFDGVPHLTDKNPVKAESQTFLTENSLLYNLRPSKGKWKIRIIFERVIAYILQFFTLARPNTMKERLPWIIRAGGSHAVMPMNLTFGQLGTYYNRFLTSEKSTSPHLKSSFEQLEKDTAALIGLNKAALQNKYPNDADKKKYEAIREEFAKKYSTEILKMQNGGSRILLLNHALPGLEDEGTIKGSLYCIISKHEGKFTLKFIGTGAIMALFSPKNIIPLAGQEKVIRELVFENIPENEFNREDRLNKILKKWCHLQEPIKPQEILDYTADLSAYKKTAGSLNDLTACADRVDHLFWNVIQALPAQNPKAVPSNPLQIGLQETRMKLRANLYSLYDLYDSMKYSLQPDSMDYPILLSVFEGVSEEILLASQKGILSTTELNEIRQDLAVIEKALQQAKKIPTEIPAKLSVQNQTVRGLFLKDINTQAIHPINEVANQVKLGRRTEGSLPRNEPIQIPGLEAIPAQIYDQINTKEEFLKYFRELSTQTLNANLPKSEKILALQQMCRLINEVPFNIFDKDQNKNNDSFWWKFNKHENDEIMGQINKLTKFIVEFKPSSQIGQNEFEAVLIMTNMVAFLNALVTSDYVESVDSYSMMEAYKNNGRYDKSRQLVRLLTSTKKLCDFSKGCKKHFRLIRTDYDYLKATPPGLQKFKTSDIPGVELFLPKENFKFLESQIREMDKLIYDEKGYFRISLYGLYGYHTEQFLKNKIEPQKWVRHCKDPYLIALYKFALSKPENWNDTYGKFKKDGTNTPEAFHDNPEAIFDHYKEHFKELYPHLSFSSPSQTFTEDEMKRLLRLLAHNQSQSELLAFMHESPHLMRNANVRNFFDALFFDYENLDTFLTIEKDPKLDPSHMITKTIPEQIQQEIVRLEQVIEAALAQEEIIDLDIIKERVDLVTYYYEMKEKLCELYPIYNHSIENYTPSTAGLAKLRQLCETRKEINPCLGNVLRVQLRHLLRSDNRNISEILKLFALIRGGYTDYKNTDPYFEEELSLHWQHIVKKCEETNPNLQSFLDQLCYQKDLPLNGSEWKKVKTITYRNGRYEVNLKTLEISLIELIGAIEQMDPALAGTEEFMTVIGGELADDRVRTQEHGNIKIFSLNDVSGRPIQIEKENDRFHLFKKFNLEGGKWLKNIPKSLFSPESLQKKQAELLKPKEENPGVFATLKLANDMMKAMNDSAIIASLPFFNHGIYIDTTKPSSLYCVDKKGDIAFQIHFKDTAEGLSFESITDYRSNPPKTGCKIVTGSLANCEQINLLSSFENVENIVLWNENGLLKQVEMPRYDLSFNYQNGQLHCTNPSFEGYQLDLSATLSEKRGLQHSILLTHSDPTKPKKLLVADSDCLDPVYTPSLPKARGFGYLFLIYEMISMFYNHLKHNLPIKIAHRFSYRLNPNKASLTYRSFDIRPYSGEICEKDKGWEYDVIDLIKQAVKTSQPTVAIDLVKKIRFRPDIFDKGLFKHFMKFITSPTIQKGEDSTINGFEAALKLKLCFTMKKYLKKHKKLTQEIGGELNSQIFNLGKIYFADGEKIPKDLQLTKEELVKLGKAYKTRDKEYYDRHVKIYFMPKGTVVNPLKTPEGDDQLDTQFNEWKQERSPVSIKANIKKMEASLNPNERLSDEDLSYTIPRAASEIAILQIPEAEINNLFTTYSSQLPKLDFQSFVAKASCEKEALKNYQTYVDNFQKAEAARKKHTIKVDKNGLKYFVEKKLHPLRNRHEEEVKNAKFKIEELVRQSSKTEEQLAIFAGKMSLATFDELRKALVQNNIEELKKAGRLPSTIDLSKLRQELITYFDALSRRNGVVAAIKCADEIIARGNPNDKDEWNSLSEAFYRLISLKRLYDANKDPRLLAFEAQQFINLRPLDGGLEQFDLVNNLVQNPYGVTQAPTGSGKTAVLSVLGALLSANGKTLVGQKVLPALYQQTFDKLHDVLGDLFGMTINPLRFNLKMRLTQSFIEKVNGQQQKVDHSIFMNMYHDLLEVIKNRGCVETDYKSLPLLEEMFWKVGQTIMERQQAGQAIDPVTKEHFTYLRKILILLGNKAKINEDEFDQPNRPIQKIQLDLGIGAHKIPEFLIDSAINIFGILEKDQNLGLLKNIQRDLSEEMRQGCIDDATKKIVKQLTEEANDLNLQEDLINYCQGKNENILARIDHLPNTFKDKMAAAKDWISIYLPLLLRKKEASGYARSDDGSRTVPCYNGEKRDAKFGTILEQIGYKSLDYLQKGITLYDLKIWLDELKKEWDEAENDQAKRPIQARFEEIFPGQNLVETALLLTEKKQAKKLVTKINQDLTKVKKFLRYSLSQLQTSGALVSMDPQNSVDMIRAVSAVSATMGPPDSLHRRFKVNEEMNGQIQAEMVYRLRRRAERDDAIPYDPEHPEEILQKTNGKAMNAIIDGAGAFRDGLHGAETVKLANASLEEVGYHDEEDNLTHLGQKTKDLKKKGFFFAQAKTRGTDIALNPDAKAVLTLNEKDGMREYFQKEGRLRLDRQRYQLAIPKYQAIPTVNHEMSHAVKQDALVDAQDIFRKSKQELRAIIRNALRKKLLAAEAPEAFVTLFQNDEWRQYFISKPDPHFNKAGSYFNARKHIQYENVTPGEVLNALKNETLQKAQLLGLEDAVAELNSIRYSEVLLAKMPEKVAPVGSLLPTSLMT